MWRSVAVAVTCAVVLVCTEPTGTVDTDDGVDAPVCAQVAIRLSTYEGGSYVLMDRTASVVRAMMHSDGDVYVDTVYIPIGNECVLTHNELRPVSGYHKVTRKFVVHGDTSISR